MSAEGIRIGCCWAGTWPGAAVTAATAAFPGLDYLPTRFLPRLRAALGTELVDQLLVTNPARLLTVRE